MARSEIELLPPALRAALEAEIDPAEDLRWCGRPDAARVVGRLVAGVAVVALFALVLGGMALYAAWTARAELIAAAAAGGAGVRGGGNETWGGVWALGILGGAIFAGGAAGVPLMLLAAHRAARRTVYAVTNARVCSITLSRRGLPRSSSVEPGHPLHVTRKDGADDRGDIHLYPLRGQQNATISLIGVRKPRDVERLIRNTFDPPGTSRR